MICTPSNWRDIQRYYEGTYVKFQEFGDTLFWIQRVRESEITGKNEDGEEFILHLHESAPYTLDYLLPSKAVFQKGDNAFMLQRVPARQYKRGLCADNVQILNLTNQEKQNIGFPLLKAFVNKQTYMSLEDAIWGKHTKRAVALSSRMWFDRPSGVLYADLYAIGSVNREVRIMQINPLFREEVRPLVTTLKNTEVKYA
jgi:hypothetical protein